MSAVAAGAAYFAIVFAAGFALGAVRTLFLAPMTGETIAVALELPLMLAISWLACRAEIRRFAVPDARAPRLLMGGSAFALLIIAETLLATLLFDRSLSEIGEAWTTAAGALGLGGQIAFAVFPLLQRARR